MKALVIVAHGSRRQASNEEVMALAATIAREMGHDYPVVETGFLELAEPSIPDAISTAVARGGKDVLVLPYFLSAGRHVHEDIPAEIAKSRLHHPDIRLSELPHIGGSEQMTGLIHAMVTAESGSRSQPHLIAV